MGLHQLLKDKVAEFNARIDKYNGSERSIGGDISPGGVSQPCTTRNKDDDALSSTTTKCRKGDNRAFELNCKVEVLEHHVKTMADQVRGCKDELDKNKKKDKTNLNSTLNNSKGFLPKIHKIESVKNLEHDPQTHIDSVQTEFRRVHERMTLCEETLKGHKAKLRQFEEIHSEIPSKI